MVNLRLMKILSFLLLFLFGNFLTKAKQFKCDTKLSCGCGKTNVELGASIVNGEQSIPFSWSMIVSIQYDFLHNGNSSMHICEGTILTDSYIITSANCVKRIMNDVKQGKISIVTEIYRRSQQRKIDGILIHPNWTSSFNRYENDIALLHLSEPLTFITRTCLPIQRNTSEELMKYPLIDTNLIIVGWNRNENSIGDSHFLRQTLVSVIEHNHTKCMNIITNPTKQFCTKSRNMSENSCYDIFGSPIFQWFEDHWEQVGISSFTSNSCKSNSAISYTRIAYYREWIEENIKPTNKMTKQDLPVIYRCTQWKHPCGCGYRDAEFPESNGHEAKPYSWSMIVSIRLNNNNKHLCSGSILNESFILTSASCIANVSAFGITIVGGIHNLSSENSGIYRKVDRIYLHPNYTGISNNYINDIAILHISEPFYLENDSLIKRTCLIEKFISTSPSSIFPYHPEKLALIGWGLMNCENNIQHDSLQQIEIYTGDLWDKNCYILDEHRDMQFCAGLVNQTTVSCVGDSGSPIFEWEYDHWVQVGIASYVVDCMPLKKLRIYTRTVQYNQWISSIINDCPTPTTTTKPPIIYSCDPRLACGCSQSSVILTPSRIVGGENAIESSWSMIVSLRLYNADRHICGASILSDSYILTAAHCLYEDVSNPPVGVTIAVGMTNIFDPKQIQRTVDHVYIHPEYMDVLDGYRHDIAVLHLNESLGINNNPLLTKTCIHRVDPPLISNEYIKNGTRLSVIGWGTMKSGAGEDPMILQQTEVFAIDNNDLICRNAMNDSFTQFCAGLYEGGKDSCQGDSGGPIFQWTGQYWEQVGIVSHGAGCAVAGHPGIYTRLSYYYDWISDILKINNEHLEPQISTNKSDITSTVTITSSITNVFTRNTTISTTFRTSSDMIHTTETNINNITTTTDRKNNAYHYQQNMFPFIVLIFFGFFSF